MVGRGGSRQPRQCVCAFGRPLSPLDGLALHLPPSAGSQVHERGLRRSAHSTEVGGGCSALRPAGSMFNPRSTPSVRWRPAPCRYRQMDVEPAALAAPSRTASGWCRAASRTWRCARCASWRSSAVVACHPGARHRSHRSGPNVGTVRFRPSLTTPAVVLMSGSESLQGEKVPSLESSVDRSCLVSGSIASVREGGSPRRHLGALGAA